MISNFIKLATGLLTTLVYLVAMPLFGFIVILYLLPKSIFKNRISIGKALRILPKDDRLQYSEYSLAFV